ncbi:hypothetical protein [Flavobacterium ajazii]|uniref:hypothetical protein n=1 Tax=Flavobacterium ajazii TaxID=2692318 RepID=UPI0013D1D785|nr:hypothetical protein [Flavobacterium ajazii]
MKKILSVFLIILFCFSNLYAQSRNDSISKIEKIIFKINQNSNIKTFEVPSSKIIKEKKYNTNENIIVKKISNKIVKIEYYSTSNNVESYESIKIYLQNKKPIFIEKEAKEIIYARPVNPTNGTIETHKFLRKSKNYIFNWDKNQFENLSWNSKTNEYEKTTVINGMFEGEKFDIIRILNLSETSISTDYK